MMALRRVRSLRMAATSGCVEMALTRDFKETVQARAERDPAFRRELLQEAVSATLDGDLAGEAVLRIACSDPRRLELRPRPPVVQRSRPRT
jgi:hypothetical protein